MFADRTISSAPLQSQSVYRPHTRFAIDNLRQGQSSFTLLMCRIETDLVVGQPLPGDQGTPDQHL